MTPRVPSHPSESLLDLIQPLLEDLAASKATDLQEAIGELISIALGDKDNEEVSSIESRFDAILERISYVYKEGGAKHSTQTDANISPNASIALPEINEEDERKLFSYMTVAVASTMQISRRLAHEFPEITIPSPISTFSTDEDLAEFMEKRHYPALINYDSLLGKELSSFQKASSGFAQKVTKIISHPEAERVSYDQSPQIFDYFALRDNVSRLIATVIQECIILQKQVLKELRESLSSDDSTFDAAFREKVPRLLRLNSMAVDMVFEFSRLIKALKSGHEDPGSFGMVSQKLELLYDITSFSSVPIREIDDVTSQYFNVALPLRTKLYEFCTDLRGHVDEQDLSFTPLVRLLTKELVEMEVPFIGNTPASHEQFARLLKDEVFQNDFLKRFTYHFDRIHHYCCNNKQPLEEVLAYTQSHVKGIPLLASKDFWGLRDYEFSPAVADAFSRIVDSQWHRVPPDTSRARSDFSGLYSPEFVDFLHSLEQENLLEAYTELLTSGFSRVQKYASLLLSTEKILPLLNLGVAHFETLMNLMQNRHVRRMFFLGNHPQPLLETCKAHPEMLTIAASLSTHELTMEFLQTLTNLNDSEDSAENGFIAFMKKYHSNEKIVKGFLNLQKKTTRDFLLARLDEEISEEQMEIVVLFLKKPSFSSLLKIKPHYSKDVNESLEEHDLLGIESFDDLTLTQIYGFNQVYAAMTRATLVKDAILDMLEDEPSREVLEALHEAVDRFGMTEVLEDILFLDNEGLLTWAKLVERIPATVAPELIDGNVYVLLAGIAGCGYEQSIAQVDADLEAAEGDRKEIERVIRQYPRSSIHFRAQQFMLLRQKKAGFSKLSFGYPDKFKKLLLDPDLSEEAFFSISRYLLFAQDFEGAVTVPSKISFQAHAYISTGNHIAFAAYINLLEIGLDPHAVREFFSMITNDEEAESFSDDIDAFCLEQMDKKG